MQKNLIFLHDRFSIDYHDVRTERKYKSLWPIIVDVNNPMNQSELESNTCNPRQGRENVNETDCRADTTEKSNLFGPMF